MTPTEKDAMALADRLREAERNPYGAVRDLQARASIAAEAADTIEALIARATRAEAELAAAKVDAERGREISVAFLPVMEAMRPLVLNLERLKDAARGGE